MKGPAVMFSNRRASLAAIEKGSASAKHHRASIFTASTRGSKSPPRSLPLSRLDLFRSMTDKGRADQDQLTREMPTVRERATDDKAVLPRQP